MDFDNVKENIQPLATGRNASILQAALNVDSQAELFKQRDALENAITEYTGDDPLEPWFEYVSWIEQSCPSGGPEGGLRNVLVQCLEKFEADQRYFQDRRLIRIYIKFIDSEDNPAECYQELFNAGIGTMVADFYICWAFYYDLCGNFKKADSIYRKGIEVRAQPYSQLIQAHTNFGFSMSQRLLYQDEQSKIEFSTSLKTRRFALTSLKGSNIGSIRLGNHHQIGSDMVKSNINKNEIVLQDNANIATTNIEHSKSIVRNVIECTRNQENTREPGPWSKVHGRKKGSLFDETTRNHDALAFTILEDDLPIIDQLQQESRPLNSPLHCIQQNYERGIQLPLNFVPKNCSQEAWKVQTILDNEINPNAIPNYRKNYHYPKPNHEFSLEEYLAYKWFKRRNINNNFIENGAKFWGDEYSVGIRLYPNFANVCLPGKDDFKLSQVNLALPDNVKLAAKLNNIYPDDNTEKQFEELLYEKWQSNKQKSRRQKFNSDHTNIAENSMDETLCTNIIQNPIRKSEITLTRTRFEEDKNITKIDTISDFNNFQNHESKLCTSSTNKNDQFKFLNDFCSEDIVKDNDFSISNESFSTKHFNLFIKKQSVSTPKSIRNSITFINKNDEQNSQNKLTLPNKFTPSVPTQTDLPEIQLTLPIKQLSTILETSENNTGAKKSSLETYLSKSNTDEQDLLSYHSNPAIVKTIISNEISNSNQQQFIEPRSDKKSYVRRPLFEEETDNTINLIKDDSFGGKFTSSFLSRTDLPEIQYTLPIKELSAILETSESNTAVKQSSFDIHLSKTNIDDQELFIYHSNTPVVKTIIEDENSNLNQQLITDLRFEKKSFIVPEFEKDNDSLKKDESFGGNVNLFQKEENRTNLKLNPINFFEEKTENISVDILKRPNFIADADTEIYEFFTKTPERKNTARLKMNNYQSIDCNYSLDFQNFKDLTFSTVSTTQNICRTPKITEDLPNSEKTLLPFCFPNDTMVKSYSEQIKLDEKKNILSEENNELLNNCNILAKKKFKCNFASGMYSIINSNNTKNYKKICSKLEKKANYKICTKYPTFQNFGKIVDVKNNEGILSLLKCFHFQYKIAAISARSKLLHIPLSIDPQIRNLFTTRPISKFEDHKIEIFLPNLNTIKYTPYLQDHNNSQNKKIVCTKNEIHNYVKEVILPGISESDQNIISEIPVERQQQTYSRQFGRSLYCAKIEETEIQNHVTGDYDPKNYSIHEKTIDLTSTYICEENDDINPFSLDLTEAILHKVEFYSYIRQLKCCQLIEKMSRLRKGGKISIQNHVIEIINVIGEGAYGTVFCGRDIYTGQQFAMKQELPANLWEYFICLELRNRILNVDVLYGLMDIQYALIADNASIFLTEFSPYGSLISVCNKVKCMTTKNVDEYVVMVLISQILLIIDHLHASEIIHADIKPDNFLLMRNLMYGSHTLSIQLIDFGVSIDLKQFPREQKFSFVHKNPQFQCVEMRESRPWTYQVDLYGVATIIHVLLFGKYMDIHMLPRGTWIPKQHIPRYLNKAIWEKIFNDLLNIPDCNSMPNLQDLRALLEQEIVEKEKYVKEKIFEFNKAVNAS